MSDLPSPRQILRLWLPSPKLGRGVGGEGKIYASYPLLTQEVIHQVYSSDRSIQAIAMVSNIIIDTTALPIAHQPVAGNFPVIVSYELC